MSQTRKLGSSLKDNPFIKRDPRWTPTPKLEEENPMERSMEQHQSPTPKPRGRSFTPKGKMEAEVAEEERKEVSAARLEPASALPTQETSNGIQQDVSPAPPPPPPAEVESAPPQDVSSMHTFTQTGAAHHDLFDDIVPVDDSMRVRSEDDLFGDDFTPLAQPVVEEVAPAPAPTPQIQTQPSRGRGDGQRGARDRGRGRGRGAPVPRGGVAAAGSEPQISQQNDLLQSQHNPNPPEDAPAGPRKETHPSVRGDRRATGGNLKPKLTEDELAEKMARIQVKNASLTAAHARAEADAASFAEREQVAAKKAKEERKDRQQMMGERERNRQRKLKGMGGREWDAEKEERDFGKGGRFDGKGFAGDQKEYSDGREYIYREPKAERGGGRGGGGAGRGGGQDRLPRKEDFPALPAASKGGSRTETSAVDAAAAAAAPAVGGSWADQVESSVPAS